MHRRLPQKSAAALAALMAVLTLLPALQALAIDSSWNVDAAGNWSTATNWTAGVPNAVDDIARLTYNITAARTVTIDGSSRTVGSLYLNDDNCGYTLAGLDLKLDVSTGSALIQSDGGTGVTHTISAPVALYDSTTVAVNSATLQVSGALSSSVAGTGITKTGAGTLVLSGTNTYSGTTAVSAGALQATDGTSLPSASNLVLAGGVLEGLGETTFTRNTGASGTNTVQWTGSGGFSASGGKMTVAIGGTSSPTPLMWGSGNFVPSGSALVFGSTMADSETEFKNNINLAGATRTITVNDNPSTTGDLATISGVLSNGGLLKDGAGTLALSGANTFSGTTTVSAGTLRIGNAGALGTVAGGTTVAKGAAVQIYNNITTLAEPLTLNGMAVAGSGALRNISDNNTFAGPITLGSLSSINSDSGTLTLSNTITASNYDLILSGAGNISALGIIGLGTGNLVKDGAGTVTLTAANTFTGETDILAGILKIGNAGVLGTVAGDTFVESGAALQIYNNITTLAEPLTLAGMGVANDGALRNVSGTNTFAGPITLGGTSRINSDSGTLTLSNTITASHGDLTLGGAGNITAGGIINLLSTGRLTKDGAGTATLTAANTFAGTTMVSAGALRAISGIGLPSASNLVLAGGVLEGIGTTTFTRNMGISGTNTVQWTASGGFSASGGKMTVAIGGTSNPTALKWGSGFFVPLGYALVFGSSTADSETEFKNRINLNGAARTITVNDNAFSTSDFATISGTLSNGSLTKDGAGLLVFKGSHTYAGATTIAAGTLKLASGATMASAAFDVGSGATLDVRDLGGGFTLAPGTTLRGGGTVLGNLVVGGVVAPGESPGILTVEDITFNGTGALQIELGGTARGTQYDVLAASGMVTLQEGSSLAVTLINGFVPQGGDEFDILDFAGLSGNFGPPSLPPLGSGLEWDTSGLYTTGAIEVTPEPATLALVMAGVAGTLLSRRRR